MADIDRALVGEVISAVPYEQAFGAPLAAAIDSQTKAANSALNFILNVGFEKDADGVNRTRYAEFQFEEDNGTGKPTTRKLRVPLLSLVNIPQLEITEGEISFDLEISQSAETTDKLAAGGETEAKIGWGPFSVSFKAKASYDRSSTRKSDTRAKQHVLMKVRQAEPPEALNVLLEIMKNSAMDASAGTAPPALEDKSASIPHTSAVPGPADKTDS